MMGRALLVVGWLATIGLVATGIVGFAVTTPQALGLHLLVGLASILLLLFSHCWIMFYLIGTGKAVKSAVAEHGLEEDLVAATRSFKNRSYPWLMGAMGLAMATFVLGGGVATRVLPPWLHSAFFAITVLAQLRALSLEWSVLSANERLIGELDRRLSAG